MHPKRFKSPIHVSRDLSTRPEPWVNWVERFLTLLSWFLNGRLIEANYDD